MIDHHKIPPAKCEALAPSHTPPSPSILPHDLPYGTMGLRLLGGMRSERVGTSRARLVAG